MLPKMGVGVGVSVMLLCLPLLGVDAYSKFGRGCNDIGCMPNEECVISSMSCSYAQRDGEDCGSYPTCKRKSDADSATTAGHVNPSGSSYKTASENNIYSPASSNPTLNTNSYNGHNNGANNGDGSSASGGYKTQNGANMANINSGFMQHTTNGVTKSMTNNGNGNGHNHNGGGGGGGGSSQNNGQNGERNNPAVVDPHYVFGAPHSMPIIPNLPIFPYNAPTVAPAFQQFPQPNHPGSVLNPGIPHGLQPVNPYNPPFVFGQQPFYSAPGGTGGPPGGINGILGGSGGGLAPHSYYAGYQNPNMYNKPPPQYQNQNPFNRQTQGYSSAVQNHKSLLLMFGCAVVVLLSAKWA